jgi:hypothetical protein
MNRVHEGTKKSFLVKCWIPDGAKKRLVDVKIKKRNEWLFEGFLGRFLSSGWVGFGKKFCMKQLTCFWDSNGGRGDGVMV